MPTALRAALDHSAISPDSVGIYARRIDGRAPALALNAEQPLSPASVMKLVTTYAALEMLGPAYTWQTDFLGDGPLRDGALQGNLYIRGGGDPKITLERFWLWLRELRARGIERIDGDVILDQSLFSRSADNFVDDEPLRAYKAEPRALLVNFNAFRVRLVPDAGNTVIVDMFPSLKEIVVDNRVRSSAAPCVAWRDALNYGIETQAGTRVLKLEGGFPVSCGARELQLELIDAEAYIGALFQSLWRELGGVLKGRVRVAETPPAATLIASFHSEPLALAIRDINKYSNNVMARQLLLTLAARAQRPATRAIGVQAIETWLKANGLLAPGLIIENGSGLSRNERISARGLGKLLEHGWRSRYAPEFVSSLPIAGFDGTLQNRLKSADGAAYARLKTGSLDNVRSIAGYVIDRANVAWVVVAIVNDPRADQAEIVFQALLAHLRSHASTRPVPRRLKPELVPE